jgi:hypothetical protein
LRVENQNREKSRRDASCNHSYVVVIAGKRPDSHYSKRQTSGSSPEPQVAGQKRTRLLAWCSICEKSMIWNKCRAFGRRVDRCLFSTIVAFFQQRFSDATAFSNQGRQTVF